MTESLAMPSWAAIALIGVAVALAVMLVVRSNPQNVLAMLVQTAVLALGVLLLWNFVEQQGARDRAEERRVFAQRLADLEARALVPGSPLACLGADAGEAVAQACERMLFASPETVAASLSFVSSKLAMLREGVALAPAHGSAMDESLDDLRGDLESDRFGMVAQVLAGSEKCTIDSCTELSLFRDPSRILANLREHTFNNQVNRRVADWGTRPAASVAPAGALSQHPVPAASSLNIDFPSAASIPPVSIMNSEPGMAGQSGIEADSKPQAAPRRAAPAPAVVPAPKPAPQPRSSRAAAPPPPPPPAMPQQIVPPAAAPAQPSQQ